MPKQDHQPGQAGAAPDPKDAEDRLREIASVTDAALARLESPRLLAELLTRAQELLNTDTATVLSLDDSGSQLLAVAALGIEEEVRQGVHVPVGEGFAGRIAATRQPVMVDHVDPSTVANPLLWQRGLRALLGVPLLAGGRLVGVLHVGSTTPRTFTEHEVHLLQLVGDRIALVADAQTSAAERAAAEALQRSLVPPVPPRIAGLEFGARYVPAATGVGGDWYDVFALPEDRVGIAIGDVAGHGLAAAVVMGRLRSALRAYALDIDDPSLVLTKLDRKASHFETTMTTVAYAVVDHGRDRIRLALAGHLPPVLATSDSATKLLKLPVDPPIGLGGARPRTHSVFDLPKAAVLCFYTDGLVERRDEPIDAGMARLTRAVTAGHPEQVCAQVMAAMIGHDPTRDDVALLVLRRNA